MMGEGKFQLPGENENQDKTSYDIIKTCFGDYDGFKAAVFGKKSQLENRTGQRVKIDKNFVKFIFEDYPNKELIEAKMVVLLQQAKGILGEPEIKNFGMDTGRAHGNNAIINANEEIHKKGTYRNMKTLGVKNDD